MREGDFTLEQSRKFDGFLKIDEVKFEFVKFDGSKSGSKVAEVMRRPDAAAEQDHALRCPIDHVI